MLATFPAEVWVSLTWDLSKTSLAILCTIMIWHRILKRYFGLSPDWDLGYVLFDDVGAGGQLLLPAVNLIQLIYGKVWNKRDNSAPFEVYAAHDDSTFID